MEAVREVTAWNYNHVYLVDGNRALAYIPHGQHQPQYFQQPLRFDRRGRKFERASISLFSDRQARNDLIKVVGSKGNVYWVNKVEQTCTCPGFSFRGQCRHLEAA